MGYTQSLRAEQMGLALQMDMAVTAFLEPGPVIDFLTAQRACTTRTTLHARPGSKSGRPTGPSPPSRCAWKVGMPWMLLATSRDLSMRHQSNMAIHRTNTHIPLLEESSLYAAGTTEGSVCQ